LLEALVVGDASLQRDGLVVGSSVSNPGIFEGLTLPTAATTLPSMTTLNLNPL